ncbi:MAG: tyrosine--tRNA ligase [Leptospirales bacterium]|nr:tyrosine--tRNA ligase [Leptospirales bacterium]
MQDKKSKTPPEKPESQKASASVQAAFEKIKRGAEELLPAGALLERLIESEKTGVPLKIKAGFDPTAPDLHLGHTVLLRKMKHFQELGHEVIFLIGDFTGMIGDPTGRSTTRRQMTREDIQKNAQTYADQVFRILDKTKTTVRFNSEWCDKMNFYDVLGLMAQVTVARMIERDDFTKRLKAGDPVSLLEFMYPLVQGYDSVALKSDVELGGTDQKFNILMGRDLQEKFNERAQSILTVPLLVGLDGQKKMSKSFDNYVGISEAPYAMFAKIMSIPDTILRNYFVLLTDFSLNQVDDWIKADPFEAKKKLAVSVINDYHPSGSGEEARKIWEEEKSARKGLVLPPETPELKVTAKEILLVQALVDSKTETSLTAARKLVEQGAVKLGDNLETVTSRDHILTFPGEYAIKIGKKKYLVVKG